MVDTNTRFDDDKIGNERKYLPKFKNRDEACGFLFAGRYRGASAKLISEATGIYINTIRKLLSDKVRAYVGIKNELEDRGEIEFGKLYYTAEIVERLAKAHKKGSSAPRTRRAAP